MIARRLYGLFGVLAVAMLCVGSSVAQRAGSADPASDFIKQVNPSAAQAGPDVVPKLAPFDPGRDYKVGEKYLSEDGVNTCTVTQVIAPGRYAVSATLVYQPPQGPQPTVVGSPQHRTPSLPKFPGAPPRPKPTPKVAEPITVDLEGPEGPQDGAFSVVINTPKDAQLRWKTKYPDKAMPPLEFVDKKGRDVWVFLKPSNGTYYFYLSAQISVDKKDGYDPFAEDELTVVVGDVPDPKPPVPPGPGPNPPDPPTPPPVTQGQRHVILIYETDDVSVPFKEFLNEIRSGSTDKYLSDHKHLLSLVDDDAVRFDGGKAKILETYAPHAKFPRSLIIADQATGAVLDTVELTDESTAAGLIEFVKKNGG